MNYIRYWMAGGESEKTSLRVKAAHTQMTSDGLWRGGKYPFGYRLVHNGRVGKKNRQLYDLEIDPEQGAIVQDIFRMVGLEGKGSLQTANILNERYPDCGKTWTAQTIREMVKNPIYTGRMHMNDTVSEPIESLRLVSDEDFSFVHYAMQKRIPHQGQLQKNEKGEYSNTKLPLSEHSARLLTGLLYCANCGGRMVGTYSSKIYGGERHYRKIYRCYTGTVKTRKDENEMGVYNADRIEKAVLAVVRRYFMEFTDNPEDIWREQSRRMLKNQFSDNIRDLEAKLTKLRKQETNLRQEVVRAISGESDFDTGMLRSLLDENAAAIAETEAKLSEVKEQQGNEEEKLSVMTKHCRNICVWAEEFDKADVETQKMILARIIEKITVDKHYNIHIKFFITREEFLGMQEPTITVSEASAFMTA